MAKGPFEMLLPFGLGFAFASLALLGAPGHAEELRSGIVAWYTFEEGPGDQVRDRSGNANHGKVQGAAFVKLGEGYALKFDGEDDYADCGSGENTRFTDAMTIDVWVRPERQGTGNPGILGKAFWSYALCCSGGRAVVFYLGGANSCQAPIVPGAWSHVVASFDGIWMRVYVNGRLESARRSATTRVCSSGGSLYMGRKATSQKWDRDSRFKGMIAEARLYARALTPREIATSYEEGRRTVLPRGIGISSIVRYADRQVLLDLDLKALPILPEGARISCELQATNGEGRGIACRVPLAPTIGNVAAVLDVGDLPAGAYLVRATALGPDGRPVAPTSTVDLVWPEAPSWPGIEGPVRVLNNFVTELLTAGPIAERQVDARHEFQNPREGWVLVASSAVAEEQGQAALTLDSLGRGEALHAHKQGGARTLESMRFLPRGRHWVQVRTRGRTRVQSLVVRTVPEIMLVENQSGVVARHPTIHNDVNVTVENFFRHGQQNIHQTEDISGKRAWLDAWRKRGRKAVTHTIIPGHQKRYNVAPAQSFEFWGSSAGFRHLDGAIADEFGYGTDTQAAEWADAIRRLSRDDRFDGKTFYAYCSPLWITDRLEAPVRQAVLENGHVVVPEVYLREQRTMADARELLDWELRQTAIEWQRRAPGSLGQMVIVLGCFDAIGHGLGALNRHPGVDYKVFMDMQFNLIAKDPAFFGLRGIAAWVARYASTETLHWYGKLCRHYCLEGKTHLLSDEYGYRYLLTHVSNPDFERGLEGWTVSPAVRGSTTVESLKGYGAFQGRRLTTTSLGDRFLLMEKNSVRPNRCTQTIGNLAPGRLYSLKLIAADYTDISAGKSEKKAFDMTVRIDGAELVPSQCATEIFASARAMPPQFTGRKRGWLNLCRKVFRAKSPRAMLTISDWKGPDDAGAFPGQKLMVNFVEVQPYFEAE